MIQQQKHLRVVESEPEQHTDNDAPARELASVYDDAAAFDAREFGGYSFPRFISAVLDRGGKDHTAEDTRLVDELDATEDVDFGVLLAYPDESLMFVGSDPTANESIPWFAFTIGRHEPMPAPETAADALDLLRTPRVRDLVAEADFLPRRHGEWWLIPSQCVPAGTVFTPGVASKPYGPSPLGNHVPREYAFTVSDATFMERFRQGAPSAPATVATPPEAIDWTWRQTKKVNPPDDAPGWADIRSFADEVIVRGTVRHREDDHYVENVGEAWHRAETHDVEVYTGDAIATDVHLDYHGVG